MRRIKATVHMLLIALFLASGMPGFGPGDLNRDGAVGLEDAIMGVKELANVAEDQVNFHEGLEKTLSSINVLAGLRTVIKAGGDAAGSSSSHLEAPFLVTSTKFGLTDGSIAHVSDLYFTCHSRTIEPIHPPPRLTA